MKRICVLVLLLLTFTACPNKRPVIVASRYLDSAINTANQDDVVKQMGVPTGQQDLSSGGSVWSYQFRQARMNQGSGRSFCDELVLTFDERKVLRSYKRKGC